MRAALSTTLAATEKLNVVAEYANVSDALVDFGKVFPNIILLGVGNPGNDELAMIHILRNLFPSTQILALVTGELQGQMQTALQYGAHAVLEKTISRKELLAKLEEQFRNPIFYKENSNVQFQS